MTSNPGCDALGSACFQRAALGILPNAWEAPDRHSLSSNSRLAHPSPAFGQDARKCALEARAPRKSLLRPRLDVSLHNRLAKGLILG